MFELNRRNRIASVTETTADWFEADPKQLRGRDVLELLADDDVSGVRRALAAVRRKSESRCQTCRCRLSVADEPVAVEIEFLAAGGQSNDRVVGTIIADREPRSSDLGAGERSRFRHLFDLVDDPAVEVEMVDTEPIVRAANGAFEHVFGYEADGIVGNSLNEYIVPDDQDGKADDFDRRTTDGKINHGMVTRQTADGPRRFLYRGIPYDGEDGSRFGLAIYADVNDQPRARKHLKVLNRVLRHNLRNDMTVILGRAAEIRDQTEGGSINKSADRIVDRAERLVEISENAQIVEDVLSGAATEREHDIYQLVSSVVEASRETHPQVTIATDIDAEDVLVSSGAKIHDAVAQLLENAIEHNDDPSVRVTVRRYTPVHATTRVSSACDEVVITVADDGSGVPDNERAAVFEDDVITQLKHGTGLGLWMVRWVAEAAGGQLVYKREDGWTNIEIRLPIVRTGTSRTVPAD